MGIFSDSTRIQWTHFGKKYRLTFTKEEMDYMDLFDVSDNQPDFSNQNPNFSGHDEENPWRTSGIWWADRLQRPK